MGPRAIRVAMVSCGLSLALATAGWGGTVGAADLSVTKTDTPDPVIAGANLTYTLTVSNAGPGDAVDFVLSDATPASTTFVSATQTGGPAATLTTPAVGGTGTVTAELSSFAAGATVTFTMVVHVDPATADGATITNIATVSSTTADDTPGNDSDTETTAVLGGADLAVTKTDTPDPVTSGNNITFTITVTNSGPLNATDVVLTDATPASTTFVSATQTGGPAATLTTPAVGGTGAVTAELSSFAAGATVTFTMVVNVDATTPNGSTITNIASVSSATTDDTPANDSDTETTAVLASGVDLVVTKTDSPDPVTAGSTITFTITVNNAGADPAVDVVLTDTVPAGTTFVSASQTSGPVFTLTSPPPGGTGAFIATIASLPGGGTAVFAMVVAVDVLTQSGTTITNTAMASTTSTDVAPATNADTETTAVIGASGLPIPTVSTWGLAALLLLLATAGVALLRRSG